MNVDSFVDREALRDDEEEPEDGGIGSRPANGAEHFHDSSEEEEDDDEEAADEVRQGFIVDDEEEEGEREKHKERRRERKRRRREEKEREDELLDEEDMYLIGENNPDKAVDYKSKRLKTHQGGDEEVPAGGGIHEMFNSDEEEEEETEAHGAADGRGMIQDEMAGFIDDEESDEEERQGEPRDERTRTSRQVTSFEVANAAGLDEATLEDLHAAFGDGTDYLFALEIEEEEEEAETEKQALDIADVFEPSQLAERLMTKEDDAIRSTDEPERYQLARKPYKHLVLTDDQLREEALSISNLLLVRKNLDNDLREPFRRSIAKVLEFMIVDGYEVPFIFQHRKDYLIHAVKVPLSPDPSNPDAPAYQVKAEKLLSLIDLWDIFDLDLKFRALIDKRQKLQRTYKDLQSFDVRDDILEESLPVATTMEELQDLQEYMYFQYPVQLRDMEAVAEAESGAKRRAHSTTIFERIRANRIYELVRAFGITADAFAQNVMGEGGKRFTEDPSEPPEDIADKVLDNFFMNSTSALKAARRMFAEELVMSPKLRQVLRSDFYENGIIDCFRTDQGLKAIDELHPYYEFKYLRNQQLIDVARRPELFLRMLRAEQEGFVDVVVHFKNFRNFKKGLYKHIESDNLSELADLWNRERRGVLDMAFAKLEKMMCRNIKENLKTECENQVAKDCREVFSQRLDQAPYKPKGMALGTIPRVLTITNGSGIVNRDSLYWAYVEEEDGRVLESGTFTNLSLGDPGRGILDGKDVELFTEIVERRRPDVIGISGFSPETRGLHRLLADIVDAKDLRGSPYTDDRDMEVSDRLEVVMVNDETARSYQTSDRAKRDHPGFAPLTNYCVALAKYLQNPMKEYASLGRDITSLSLKPGQYLVPQEKLSKHLESALVDMVNLCGVDINAAVTDPATASLLPYVCGLGPRKAAQILNIINLNGGIVGNRLDLLGVNVDYPAMGVKVWNNCVSFLSIDFDSSDTTSDYLDNTRVHPEDYDIARKMAADALELDEEDIKAETDMGGQGAVVAKLVKDEAQDRVNDLILEEYAEQLEKNLNQRKSATLETIRVELQQPYEELRKQYVYLGSEIIFTMLTGETHDSLAESMVVPMTVKRVTNDHIDGKLDSGIDTIANDRDITERYDVSIRSLFQPHQVVPAKILNLNRKAFLATVSLLEDVVKEPYRRKMQYGDHEWDHNQEIEDRELLREKTENVSRSVRVVKHPLFHPFSAQQAEDFLAPQTVGDAVIRPSSKGPDHLAVTWKVADEIYQHIDVLELDKENEYSVGRILRVGGKYSYSDLDELLVNHVQMMARKINEMTRHEKFQTGTRDACEKWLQTYTQANPTRAAYAFCIDRKHAGYFHLCFQAGAKTAVNSWPVRVIPQGYELRKTPYPDMMSLCNGFKKQFGNMQRNAAGKGGYK